MRGAQRLEAGWSQSVSGRLSASVDQRPYTAVNHVHLPRPVRLCLVAMSICVGACLSCGCRYKCGMCRCTCVGACVSITVVGNM